MSLELRAAAARQNQEERGTQLRLKVGSPRTSSFQEGAVVDGGSLAALIESGETSAAGEAAEVLVGDFGKATRLVPPQRPLPAAALA